MKVGLVSHSAQMAGAERSLLAAAYELLNAGVDVCATVPKPGPLCAALNELGVPYAVIPYFWWAIREAKPLAPRIARHPPSIAAALPLAYYLWDQACDVVLTNSEVVYTGALAARLLRKPHVWQLREIREGWRFDFGSRASFALMRRTTTRFIANSRTTRDSYRPHLKAVPIDVVYPGFPIEEAPSPRPRTQKPFRCLTVGTVMPSKRQHEAIEAVVRLWSSEVDVRLDLIGGDGPDPSYRETLERAVAAEPISDHVRLVGYADDAWERIAEADCVVVPSRESFGRVAVEAMLVGTPVVASHWGAAGELIRDGETGLLYEPGDAVALAAQIRRLVEHPGECERLADAARGWASETFSEQKHLERLLQVLERACGSTQRSARP